MHRQDTIWLEEFFEAVNQFAAVADVHGRIIRINRTALEITGMDPQDVTGQLMWEIPWPALSKRNRQTINRAVQRAAGGVSVWDELKIKSQASRPTILAFSIKPVMDETGIIQYLIIEGRDVTIHSRTKAALQEIKKRFKSTFSEFNELKRRITNGRELERLRVAQDLHDGPLQEIIGASYQLKTLEASLTDPADLERLQAVEHTLQQLARSLRTVCSELRPPSLIPFGLKKAILAHVEEFRASHPEIEITLDLDFDGQILSEQTRLVFYRIYQEAMQNVLRHAQARRIWVHFHIDSWYASLEVRDDGIGFTVPEKWLQFAREGHVGLVGAVERVKEVGGEIEVTAAPGEGTRIWTTIKFQAPQLQPVMEEI